MGGDIRVRAFESDTELGVGGVLTCEFAHLGGYDGTQALSSVEAYLVIDHGVFADVDAECHIVCNAHLKRFDEEQQAQLRAALPDDLVEASSTDGAIDYSRLCGNVRQRLADGGEIR